MRARDPRCFCIDASKCLLCQRDFGRIAENLREHFIPRVEEHSDGKGGTRPSRYQPNARNGVAGTRGSRAPGACVDEQPVQRERERELGSASRVSPRGLS